MRSVLQRRTNLRFAYSQQLRRGKATGSGKEAKSLKCTFSNGVDVYLRERSLFMAGVGTEDKMAG